MLTELVNLQEWVEKTSLQLAENDKTYISTGIKEDDLLTLQIIAAARENSFTENGCGWVGLWPKIRKMVGDGRITLFDSSGLMTADVDDINFKNHKVWQIRKTDLVKLERILLPKKVEKERNDSLAFELEYMLNSWPLGEEFTTKSVMKALIAKAGKPGTCIVKASSTDVDWQNQNEDVFTLTHEMLRKRIERLKKKRTL